LHQNIFERLAYVGNFFACFCKGLSFWNFGSYFFHESQIFDKQLGKLPYLQYLWSLVWDALTLKDKQQNLLEIKFQGTVSKQFANFLITAVQKDEIYHYLSFCLLFL
jgi:hypothetical protein